MCFRPNYNERKATQIAAYTLQKSDGEMYLLKLMKLLYIIDRESLKQLGHPVTYDNYVSMDHGPVLSRTFNLMNGMVQDCAGTWNATIAPRNNHKISVADECEVSFDSLSEAEMEIADQVFEQYGHVPRFDLVDITHGFGEWVNPEGSSFPIQYEEVLQAVGYDAEAVQHIIANLEAQGAAAEFLESA